MEGLAAMYGSGKGQNTKHYYSRKKKHKMACKSKKNPTPKGK